MFKTSAIILFRYVNVVFLKLKITTDLYISSTSPTLIATGFPGSLPFILYMRVMDSLCWTRPAIPYMVSVGTAMIFPAFRLLAARSTACFKSEIIWQFNFKSNMYTVSVKIVWSSTVTLFYRFITRGSKRKGILASSQLSLRFSLRFLGKFSKPADNDKISQDKVSPSYTFWQIFMKFCPLQHRLLWRYIGWGQSRHVLKKHRSIIATPFWKHWFNFIFQCRVFIFGKYKAY